jgi:flagellar hook-length control protein FliK
MDQVSGDIMRPKKVEFAAPNIVQAQSLAENPLLKHHVRSNIPDQTINTPQRAQTTNDGTIALQTTLPKMAKPNTLGKEDTRPSILNIQTETAFSTRVENANAPAPHSQTAPTRMDLPTHVARQMIDIVQHLPTKPVEIPLNPDELGRLRLSISTSDIGLVVSVVAERPETLDLLRRHISTLGQEFQALGYEDVSFSFDGDAQSDPQSDDNPEHSSALTPLNDAQTANKQNTQIYLKPSDQTGLDLRL